MSPRATNIRFLTLNSAMSVEIVEITRYPDTAANTDSIGLKLAIALYGADLDFKPYFSLIPKQSYDLLLTVSVGSEFEVTCFLTDEKLSFAAYSGGICFLTYSEIKEMFKKLLEASNS